ncbi:MAG TPA: aminoglycoside phosphotransferase family protein [Pyrinomonadaceae bacterium]|nr:aminoglycoside phosphotransferase family protein [Pyrinomonadaceae bacterium]
MKFPKPSEFEAKFNDPIWIKVGAEICLRQAIAFREIRRSEHGESVVLLVDDRYVIKIYKPSKRGFERETAALDFVSGKIPFVVPDIVANGEINGLLYLVTAQVPGQPMTRAQWLQLDKNSQMHLLEDLANGLRELHSLDGQWVDFDWAKFVGKQAANVLERQRLEGGNPEWFESLPSYVEENLYLIPLHPAPVFMHGDVHFGNLRLTFKNGRPKISGIFDFADSLRGFHEYEFIAIGVLMIQGQGDLQRHFFRYYGYEDHEINEALRRRMMLLTCFYEWSSLRRYAERLRPEAINYTLVELERAIWNFA